MKNIGIICYPTFGGSGIVASKLGIGLSKKYKVHFICYEKPVKLNLDHPNIFFHKVNIPNYPLFEYPPYELEKQKNKKHIASYINGHYFITSDSGILSLIFPHTQPTEIVEINISGEYNTDLFPAKDIFTKVACHILRGGKLNVIGEKMESFKSFMTIKPVEINSGQSLVGEVIYIDRFGNIITNIEKDLFQQKKGEQNFVIHLPRGKKTNNSRSD